ncbi:MAG: hypothetical protein U0572_02165 [Phycisphaerales bacterium]
MRAADATTYRVRHWSPPPNATINGASWETAYPTIEEALDVAKTVTGGPHTILVAVRDANDPWHPRISELNLQVVEQDSCSGSAGEESLCRYRRFMIDFDVIVRGGYEQATAQSAGSDDRPPDWQPTILSGDFAHNDSAASPMEQYDATNDENALNVVVFRGAEVTYATEFDGFVVERGNCADDPTDTPQTQIYDAHFGGAILLTHANGQTAFAQPWIQNCVFRLNGARVGGAIASVRAYDEEVTELQQCIVRTSEFRRNYASERGGAIAVHNGVLDMAGSLVVDGKAPFGGGLSLEGTYFAANSTATAAEGTIVNCTIARNWGSVGCGVYINEVLDGSAIVFRNCIVCLNATPGSPPTPGVTFEEQFFLDETATPMTLQYCAFPWGPPETDPNAPLPGTGCLQVEDPYFVDDETTDYLARDYRVHPCSPCLDHGRSRSLQSTWDDLLPVDDRDADDDQITTGEPLPDVERHERVIDSDGVGSVEVDMGAYEHATVCVGDIDSDGQVGSSDLAILLGEWIELPSEDWCLSPLASAPPPCHCADIDNDRHINASDLALLLGAWGECPIPSETAIVVEYGGDDAQGANSQFTWPIDPEFLATFLGFDDVQQFALWLGDLSPQTRAAALEPLLGGA